MFFMIGVNSREKELPFHQMAVCSACGAYGRYSVFMTYSVLTLFFIPCFRWNRQYFARTSCCGTVYRLDPAIGRCIERGEDVTIRPEHLQKAGSRPGNGCCPYCGYPAGQDFVYCPKCGRPL